MAAPKRKAVPQAATTSAGRIPRKLASQGSNRHAADWLDARPAWGLQIVDHEVTGDWSWTIGQPQLMEIMSFLAQMEKRTWAEIRRDMAGGNNRRDEKHKFIPVAHLCKEARDRLEEIELDDQDRLFRFRLGNLKRLWGVILPDDHMFYLLWWDENHKVCPSADR
ncbi:hypothetical protein [Leifsonia sp. NPDC058248]|uniref:hypothetical protein n=1 Tax=Leifsonia sp. NPDC058248 TaxID=3346402 RepID=UPI0036DE04E5